MLRESDGRVEVESTKLGEELMKDFIVLPYVHTKIHHQTETAKQVDFFLKNGRFER